MNKTLKYSLITIGSILAIGGAGMFIYFDIKAKKRAKIYETPTPANDALQSLMETATPISLALAAENNSVPLAEYTDYQSVYQDYAKYETYGAIQPDNNYGSPPHPIFVNRLPDYTNYNTYSNYGGY